MISPAGRHIEFEVHNPNLVAATAFQVRIFDGWGNIYGGVTNLAPNQSLWIDLHVPDTNLGHGLVPPGPEVGITAFWALSTLGFQLNFDAWTGEGIGAPPFVPFPCPRLPGSIGPVGGFFGCSGVRASDPIAPFDADTIDPALPTFGVADPADRITFADLLPDLSNGLVPEPASLVLLGAGLAALAGAGWGRRRGANKRGNVDARRAH